MSAGTKRRPNQSLGSPGGSAPPTPSGETLHVVCRFRPPRRINGQQFTACDNYKLDTENNIVEMVLDEFDKRNFSFDRVLGAESLQEDVFAGVESAIDCVLAGFNGTVLAC